LYVDQKPAGDLSEVRAKEFGFKVYPTIAEAVCCGGPKLAVDAVLIIGEHGEYPRNEKGQILYPRFEFFPAGGESVRVQRTLGSGVQRQTPFLQFREGQDDARHGAPVEVSDAGRIVAAGDLAIAGFRASFGMPDRGCAAWWAQADRTRWIFHALEALQCMMERRKGGERGVKSVQLIQGDAVWQAASRGAGRRNCSDRRYRAATI